MKLTAEAYNQLKNIRDVDTMWVAIDKNGVGVAVKNYKSEAVNFMVEHKDLAVGVVHPGRYAIFEIL